MKRSTGSRTWESWEAMQQVYEILSDQEPTPCTPQRISERTGISIYLIRGAIRQLLERCLIAKTAVHDGYSALPLELDSAHPFVHVLSEQQWNSGEPPVELFGNVENRPDTTEQTRTNR